MDQNINLHSMKIAILDDYADASKTLADWDQISNAEASVFTSVISDQAKLVAALTDFDVICIMRERTPFPASLLDQLPKLQLLVTSGPRNLSIDLDAATRNNVVVCGTQSRKTTTSELSILLMLALSRDLIPEINAMQSTGWQSGLGRDLHGQNLGLIGLGKIGEQMSILGKALGMTIHAWSPNLKEARCNETGVCMQSSLKALMQVSDIVSIHMVLSDRTRHLVDQQALSSMRERAILINTSRGPIVDQQALLNGLALGRPWKAGLDVYDEEPLPLEHPLRNQEMIDSGRLLLSPHLGYATEQTFKLFYTQTVEAVVAWQQGKPIRVLNA